MASAAATGYFFGRLWGLLVVFIWGIILFCMIMDCGRSCKNHGGGSGSGSGPGGDGGGE